MVQSGLGRSGSGEILARAVWSVEDELVE